MLNILKKRPKNNGQELRDLLSGYQLPRATRPIATITSKKSEDRSQQ